MLGHQRAKTPQTPLQGQRKVGQRDTGRKGKWRERLGVEIRESKMGIA